MTRLLRARLGGRLLALILLETVLILGAVALAAWLRVGTDWWLVITVEGGLPKALYVAVICQVCLYYADLYNARIMNDQRECSFASSRHSARPRSFWRPPTSGSRRSSSDAACFCWRCSW
jgi:hypothetical protein